MHIDQGHPVSSLDFDSFLPSICLACDLHLPRLVAYSFFHCGHLACGLTRPLRPPRDFAWFCVGPFFFWFHLALMRWLIGSLISLSTYIWGLDLWLIVLDIWPQPPTSPSPLFDTAPDRLWGVLSCVSASCVYPFSTCVRREAFDNTHDAMSLNCAVVDLYLPLFRDVSKDV